MGESLEHLRKTLQPPGQSASKSSMSKQSGSSNKGPLAAQHRQKGR